MRNIFQPLFLLLALGIAGTLTAQVSLSGTLSGANEVPANTSTATGTFEGQFDPYSKVIAFRVDFKGLSSNAVAAHFHANAAGTNGPVVLDFGPQGFPFGATSGTFVKVLTLTDAQAKDLIEGRLYVNIHTPQRPGGEIRAQIEYGKRPANQPVQLKGAFSGAQETPAVQTTGTGKFEGIYDPASRYMAFRVDYSGLSANAVAAHFHTGAMGVAGPVTINLAPLGFPLGGTFGSFVGEITLTEAQASSLAAGNLYVNVHTGNFPAGEIRAQVNYDRPANANPRKVTATLEGAQETPPVTTTGTGTFDGVFDPVTRALAFKLDFSQLSTPTLFAHFHRGAIGTPGPVTFDLVPVGFPVDVTAGTLTRLVVLSEAQAADLLAGNLYVNIHTTQYRPGEIRGQLNVAPNLLQNDPTDRAAIESLRPYTSVQVWPNPATDMANVSVSCGHQPFSLQLLDVAGKQVRRVESEGAPVVLDLGSLQKGLYVLQARFGDRMETQKLIVR